MENCMRQLSYDSRTDAGGDVKRNHDERAFVCKARSSRPFAEFRPSSSSWLFVSVLSRAVVPAQTTDPDVAVAHGLLMVLQHQRGLGGLRRVTGHCAVDCRPHQLLAVVQQDAVEEYGEE